MSNNEYKKYNNKCDECGGTLDLDPVKGRNNTYLCGGDWMKGSGVCGNNVCFKCGKLETGTEWVEDEDCQGNKVMREREKSMFILPERDENDPDRMLYVCYCDEHKEEAKKSPLVWTRADTERIERKREQKRETVEEKLNSQKGLFYCQDNYASASAIEGYRKIVGVKYGCFAFWGKENGRNFNLLIPDTHPVLDSFKHKEKVKNDDGSEGEIICHFKNEQFYLIEGVDNLPLEARDSNSSQFNVPNSYGKIVGLNDKITITPADIQGKPEKNEPTKDQPINNSPNSQPKDWNDKSLLQYFKTNNYKSIKLEGINEKITIEYNNGSTNTDFLVNFPELKGIDNILQNKNDKKITRQELELSNNSHNTSTKKPENNYLLVVCVISGILIIGAATILLLRKKLTKKR